MNGHAQSRWYRPVAFLVSGLLHLSLAAAVFWPQPEPGIALGDGDDYAVGVTLAMFEAEAEQPDPMPEPTDADSAKPEPQARPEPDPAPVEAPPPPPEEEPIEEPEPPATATATATEEPPPEPAAEVTALKEPEPELKPEPEQKPKPKPKPKPKSEPKQTHKPKLAENRPQPSRSDRESSRGSSQRAASGGTRSGADTKSAKAAQGRYLAELQRAIARHRHYPRQAQRRNLEGVVTVSFVILADGRIRNVQIDKGSGHGSLDQAAIETLKRLSVFKPIPQEIGKTRWPLRVPIRFALK